MRVLTTTVLLLALGVVALAKPAPVERPSLALAHVYINISTVGAMLERDYFLAPQLPFNAGGLLCRLQPSRFNETRLAQSCR